jgi:predicted acetyltransferase
VFAPVYDVARSTRVGWSERDDRWWGYRLFDGKGRRGGSTTLRATVHDGPDGVDGFLLWRVKSDWDGSGPNGTVVVQELVANTPAAYRALIRFALSVDLTRAVRLRFGSLSEPLQYMVTDPRRLDAIVRDGLWLRVLDVPAALAARRYAAPIDVVLEIDDARIPANTGRWRVVGSPDAATCTKTDDPADLAVDMQALGSAYLGGASLVDLAAAGKVTEIRPGTLVPASLGFGWHVTPSTTEVF